MKKNSTASSSARSGTFPSPGTPTYRDGAGAAGYRKGWSSERVPLPGSGNRRYAGSGVLLPFANGRTLPSKWEDAERWILSPVSGDPYGSSLMPPLHHRRPKSKSGPLVAHAGKSGAYSSTSPLVPCFDSGRVGNFTAASPFMAGVLMPEHSFLGNDGSARGGASANMGGIGRADGSVSGGSSVGGKARSADGEPYTVRSASTRRCSDSVMESSSSLPRSHDSNTDEQFEGTKEVASTASISVFRKDVATQMSPERSPPYSPKEIQFSPSASTPALEELENHFSKFEVRDVQVDDRVTVTRWSKKQISRGSDRRSSSFIEWKKKTVEANTSAWGIAETAKSMSKCKREEAKITAWENLQNAKAETEIRKLEMKLEKKRSSSMEKILNKLRSAQKKAEEMRNAVADRRTNRVAATAKKTKFFCKSGPLSSLTGCFACHTSPL
ncbi:uncharacterized protein LOC121989519 isoform X1 [Zingiber officinale]|uniref:uncharacterized protein LOC121989519 isoform X1 n=1 Tax=Zingiber officinale TaxID=94328 RepID=UPI001C4C51B2|nr:uncharacterized protein LOC121989519 isoform X1 [Zingiber officinale]XP_042399552.1 uncharacterized protein LOC121989519 isoform X1 [Zingiber officinale]